jgi:hypothetical protein
VVAVADRLGHENASLVLSTYGHLMPDSEERTRRAIDTAWSAPDVPQAAEVRKMPLTSSFISGQRWSTTAWMGSLVH